MLLRQPPASLKLNTKHRRGQVKPAVGGGDGDGDDPKVNPTVSSNTRANVGGFADESAPSGGVADETARRVPTIQQGKNAGKGESSF